MPAPEIPKTFHTPALGKTIRLGDIYDASASHFLGVQLFDDEQIKAITTTEPTPYAKLDVSMSNSFEKKSSVIDVSASISVGILGGLIDVKGSAKYLNDTKSNSSASAWAMSLAVRREEKRLSIEDATWKKVLKWVMDDYITTGKATHYVSSITFGGNVIVSLSSLTSELTEEEGIEGTLSIEFKKLAGVVDISGKADANIKAKYAHLDDKFDLSIYGDIELETTPVNPKDVLDFFPTANEKIGSGVPVSVTLQPFPPNLVEIAKLINTLDRERLSNILSAFGDLDDVRNRFQVLQISTKKYKKSLPEFATIFDNAFITFEAARRVLVTRLRDFLVKFQSDNSASEDSALATDVRGLCEKHNRLPGDYRAPKYLSSLTGLEQAYSNFQEYVTVVKNVGKEISTLQDVTNAVIKLQDPFALFLMPPLSNSAFVALARFSSLTRGGLLACSKERPEVPCYLLYVEDPATLEAKLPNQGYFAALKEPSAFLGKKVHDGSISWTLVVRFEGMKHPATLYDFELGLYKGIRQMTSSPSITNLDTAKSFSIATEAMVSFLPENPRGKHVLLSASKEQFSFVCFVENSIIHFSIYLATGIHVLTPTDGNKTLVKDGERFSIVFKQDMTDRKWIFYVNGKENGHLPIEKLEISPYFGGKLSVAFGGSKDYPWGGYIYNSQVFQPTSTEAAYDPASTKTSDSTQISAVKTVEAAQDDTENK